MIEFKKKWIRGRYYLPTVMRVEEKDDKGRPFVVTLLYEEQVAELSKDDSKNEFWVIFTPEAMTP